MSSSTEHVDLVWSLIEQIKIPMVVTHTASHGELRARPMVSHPEREKNAILLLVDAESTKDQEIDCDNNVCLVFADIQKQEFVSVTGIAELSDDRGAITRLWSQQDAELWADGAHPSIRLLKVTPTAAEYWDSANAPTRYIATVVKFLTGGSPDVRINKSVTLP